MVVRWLEQVFVEQLCVEQVCYVPPACTAGYDFITGGQGLILGVYGSIREHV